MPTYRWNTTSGESKPYDFYQLPKHFRKGPVRKAYIQTVMYEHKSAIANLPTIFKINEEELEPRHFCPSAAYYKRDPYGKPGDEDTELPIRMRDEPKYTWQKCTFNDPEPETSEISDVGFDFPEALNWISPKVKTLIKKLCEPIPDDFNAELTENVMYMLVVNETLTTKLPDGGMKSQVGRSAVVFVLTRFNVLKILHFVV